MSKIAIGIPAYNEENNIGNLLTSLLGQKGFNEYVENIFIVSDASSDGTKQKVLNFALDKILFYENKERVGRAMTINKIFSLAQAENLLIVDADTIFANDHVLEQITTVLDNNLHASLFSGKCLPLEPKNFLQKILSVGHEVWLKVIKQTKSAEMYTCAGAAVLFRKDLYKKMEYPKTSADDVYPYLYTKSINLNYYYINADLVNYRLPLSVEDFFKQHTRYNLNDYEPRNYFSKEFLASYYVIKPKDKIKVFLKSFLKNPILLSIYALLVLFVKLKIVIYKKENNLLWEISKSTKG